MIVSGVFYDSLGSVSFDQTVDAYNIVAVPGLLLAVIVAGVGVRYVVGKVILGVSVGVSRSFVGWGRGRVLSSHCGHSNQEDSDLKQKRVELVKFYRCMII